MSMRWMKIGRSISPISPLKSVAMATSLQRSQNSVGIISLYHTSVNRENLVKIGSVFSENIWRPLKTRSHPKMSRVTLNLDLSKLLLCVSSQSQDLSSHQKIKHAHLLVLIWERLQMPTTTTTTMTTTTTPDATVQPLGRHIANN